MKLQDLADALNAASKICHEDSFDAGWWHVHGLDHRKDVLMQATKVSLIHSEVSEALEGLRKDKNDDHLPHRKAVEVELADTLVRVFDLAGCLNLDLGGALIEKMAYNKERQDHKVANREAAGGKKF